MKTTKTTTNYKSHRKAFDLVNEILNLENNSDDVKRYKALIKSLNDTKKVFKANDDIFTFLPKDSPYYLVTKKTKPTEKKVCNFELLQSLSSDIYNKVVSVKQFDGRFSLNLFDSLTDKKVY